MSGQLFGLRIAAGFRLEHFPYLLQGAQVLFARRSETACVSGDFRRAQVKDRGLACSCGRLKRNPVRKVAEGASQRRPRPRERKLSTSLRRSATSGVIGITVGRCRGPMAWQGW